MPSAFVSYAREDQGRVEPVLELLRRLGWSLRSDHDIEGAQNYLEQVGHLIDGADLILYFHSAHAAQSALTQRQIGIATTSRRFVLPVRLDDTAMVTVLDRIQPLELTEPRDLDEVAHLIVRAVESRFGTAKTAASPPMPASARTAPDAPRSRTSPPARTAAAPNEPASAPAPPASTHAPMPMQSRPLMSVSYSEVLPADQWRPLHAYLFPRADTDAVARDIDVRRKSSDQPHRISEGTASPIALGTQVTVIPQIEGVEFRPAKVEFAWRERWHRADFDAKYAGRHARNENGTVSWFVGPVCVGQVFMAVRLAPAEANVGDSRSEARGVGYESVFVSYSHNDHDIVDWLENAYEALGMEYLRDVKTLRSGENWSDQLARLIDRADLFQLCWSTNASASSFVEQEWRHALALNRPRFIRPLYWEQPIPPPPSELSGLHFARLEVPKRSLFGRITRMLRLRSR